ncbi:hypothetical protein LJC52_04520 [Bacteroidales bacterium OttesenSCG-928-A17]|nr:hypothetical protein [Bacteroidales bacterium OttesenSCG-928-A17]
MKTIEMSGVKLTQKMIDELKDWQIGEPYESTPAILVEGINEAKEYLLEQLIYHDIENRDKLIEMIATLKSTTMRLESFIPEKK